MSIVGACDFDGSWASGTVPAPAPSFGFHCFAPAGLVTAPTRSRRGCRRSCCSNVTGVVVQAPSRPLVIVSPPLPVPKLFFQPRPCSSMGAPSGSRPTYWLGSAAPWVLPNVCPPAMSATVSSSFIAMRRNVSRMSLAAASGSGLPFGPSGFT